MFFLQVFLSVYKTRGSRGLAQRGAMKVVMSADPRCGAKAYADFLKG